MQSTPLTSLVALERVHELRRTAEPRRAAAAPKDARADVRRLHDTQVALVCAGVLRFERRNRGADRRFA